MKMKCLRRIGKSKLSRPRSGFTLIELLVVMSIIVILAGILFPIFARVREKARQTSCLSNMRQIGMALQMYIGDHGERLPSYIQGDGSLVDSGHTVSTGGYCGRAKYVDRYGNTVDFPTATYSDTPTTPAQRFLLDMGGSTGWHYYSWMDSLNKYTKNVQVYTCPSHTGYPTHPSQTSPPYDAGNGTSDPNWYCQEVEDGSDSRWPPSLQINGFLNWYRTGHKPVAMGDINGPTSKIFVTHGNDIYGYMEPTRWAQFGLHGIQSATGKAIYNPHNNGSILVYVDGHAKWVSWADDFKWTCRVSATQAMPGTNLWNAYYEANEAAGQGCGFWMPKIKPPFG
jgi:prepilin-type N-terminal cleavage/methylation domain-containing protein/prepilin-type processing-associated H-X9-DG protein